MFWGKDGAMRGNACGACRLLAALVCLVASAAPARSDVPPAAAIVTTRCLDCHDAVAREGGLSLEGLAAEITPETAAVWTKVLHELDTERMPPPDAEQPTRAEREAAILDLEGRLAAVVQTDDDRHRTVFRRLNRDEYRNTIEDLLQLDAPGFDPAEGFPEDIRTHGFATNGESLVTSGFLTRKYLEAAEAAIGRAVHFEPRPEVQTLDLRPPFHNAPTIFYLFDEALWYSRVAKRPQPWQTLLERPGDSPLSGYVPLDEVRAGMPQPGRYRIRVHAEAKFRTADMRLPTKFPLGPEGEWEDGKPLRLQVVSGSLRGIDYTKPENEGPARFIATHQQQAERELGHWDLPDDESVWLECEAWLDAGEYPRFVFPNGVNPGNYRINHYFHENRFALLDKEALARFEDNVERGGGFTIPMWVETPRIRVMQVAIEGPLEPEWPPRSHRAIFGAEPYRSDRAEEVLHAFATKAWRRPVDKKEIAPLVALLRSAEAAGEPAEAAITRGLTGVLCSPPFLYREEQGPRLNDHELAARLSYFLAVSQPDDRLRQFATEGRLTDPAVRRAEAERLLTATTSDRFIDAFLDGWLALWKLGSMAPDRAKFRAYYDDALEPAMRQETRLVFKQLLATNGPAVALLDGDETIMNAGLARLYGIPAATFEAALGKPVEGLSATDLTPDAAGTAPSRSRQQTGFAAVSLPDHRRGGLLGQASILTLTANGVDTSPVIRGAWVLENILGTPPPPPPPNVPVIEPDIRGATTIRERLEKHRAVAACATCHALIDPPGFALESFDAIGRWRDAYTDSEKKPPVDPSGELSGASFKNVMELKRLLVERPERFARCVVEKLLVMALGRELDVADRPAIRQILARAAPDGYRLQDLIVLCCESELFAWK
jgi:hypothetical protein